LEKLTYKKLINFLEQNSALYAYQFGFRKSHSTVQAGIELLVLDNTYEHCDNHKITMGIYLDLQKAFDTANHLILLKKLSIYGVRETVLKWFTSYLSNRKQYVAMNNYESEFETAHTLYINNKVIKNVASCKYLGILIDNDLKWIKHIKYIYNKLINFVSIFNKIRFKLPSEILRSTYFAFVHLHGIEIYGNTTANHLFKLLVFNNKLLRILQHKPFKTHTIDLYNNTYFTLPLQLLHPYQILIFMHRYVHHRNELHVKFSTYFEDKQFIYHNNTRHKHDFHTRFVQTEFGKTSIKYKRCKLWNNLPDDIKTIRACHSFRFRLKKLLLQLLE